MFSSIIMTATLAAVVTAGPARMFRANDTLPYPVTDMVFTGTLNGQQVSLNGSAQSIMAQAEALIPGFKTKEHLASISGRSLPPLKSRSKSGIACCPVAGQDWGYCDGEEILQGADYLNGLGGTCGIDARSCGRISCSYEAAIYFCNDNDARITPACGYLGSYAQDIVYTCGQGLFAEGPYAATCGQEFDTDKYNIIVRHDNC